MQLLYPAGMEDGTGVVCFLQRVGDDTRAGGPGAGEAALWIRRARQSRELW